MNIPGKKRNANTEVNVLLLRKRVKIQQMDKETFANPEYLGLHQSQTRINNLKKICNNSKIKKVKVENVVKLQP